MNFFRKAKDGGPESTVTGYWLIEAKRLFSIALLKFEDGSRESYHSHAFNSISWVLWGNLREEMRHGDNRTHRRSLFPVLTFRGTFHRVFSAGTTWVFTVRGPWLDQWYEFDPVSKAFTILKNGRVAHSVHTNHV